METTLLALLLAEARELKVRGSSGSNSLPHSGQRLSESPVSGYEQPPQNLVGSTLPVLRAPMVALYRKSARSDR